MDQFKIEAFEREHGANSFPEFRTLRPQEASQMLALLKSRLKLPKKSIPLEVLQAVDQRSAPVDGADAAADGFDLHSVLIGLGFSAPRVWLSWYRFDRIDEFAVEDVCTHFSDIFYPSSDDVEIYAADISWMVMVKHYGTVKALNLSTS